MTPVDIIIRRLPGALWWRFYAAVSFRRGDWESGYSRMYAGLIDRWAIRVGPLNIAVMRLR